MKCPKCLIGKLNPNTKYKLGDVRFYDCPRCKLIIRYLVKTDTWHYLDKLTAKEWVEIPKKQPFTFR